MRQQYEVSKAMTVAGIAMKTTLIPVTAGSFDTHRSKSDDRGEGGGKEGGGWEGGGNTERDALNIKSCPQNPHVNPKTSHITFHVTPHKLHITPLE